MRNKITHYVSLFLITVLICFMIACDKNEQNRSLHEELESRDIPVIQLTDIRTLDLTHLVGEACDPRFVSAADDSFYIYDYGLKTDYSINLNAELEDEPEPGEYGDIGKYVYSFSSDSAGNRVLVSHTNIYITDNGNPKRLRNYYWLSDVWLENGTIHAVRSERENDQIITSLFEYDLDLLFKSKRELVRNIFKSGIEGDMNYAFSAGEIYLGTKTDNLIRVIEEGVDIRLFEIDSGIIDRRHSRNQLAHEDIKKNRITNIYYKPIIRKLWLFSGKLYAWVFDGLDRCVILELADDGQILSAVDHALHEDQKMIDLDLLEFEKQILMLLVYKDGSSKSCLVARFDMKK